MIFISPNIKVCPQDLYKTLNENMDATENTEMNPNVSFSNPASVIIYISAQIRFKMNL